MENNKNLTIKELSESLKKLEYKGHEEIKFFAQATEEISVGQIVFISMDKYGNLKARVATPMEIGQHWHNLHFNK